MSDRMNEVDSKNPSLFSKIKQNKVIFILFAAVLFFGVGIGASTYYTSANSLAKQVGDHATAIIDQQDKDNQRPAFLEQNEEPEEIIIVEPVEEKEEPSEQVEEKKDEEDLVVVEVDSEQKVNEEKEEKTREPEESEVEEKEEESKEDEVEKEEKESTDEVDEDEPEPDSDKETNEKRRNELFQQLKNQVFTVYSSTHQGSAFLYNDQGIVITNAHVVKGDLFVNVETQSGVTHVAEVIGYSNETDVAVLLVNDLVGQNPAPLEKGNSITVGDEVITLGTPKGAGFTMTSGKITEIGLNFSIGSFYYLDLYESSARTKPGSSGGPLISLNSGKIVGINSAMDKHRDSISYSIPLFTVDSIIQDWVKSPLSQSDLLVLYGEDEAVVIESDGQGTGDPNKEEETEVSNEDESEELNESNVESEEVEAESHSNSGAVKKSESNDTNKAVENSDETDENAAEKLDSEVSGDETTLETDPNVDEKSDNIEQKTSENPTAQNENETSEEESDVEEEEAN
ncbi:S1C family serine protease [Alkalihalobacillus sp. 1P02AB]|uniref:S1C family serine protease n=1 Tax=Alkalihalobacillus sp. 1P02AB TaxID=3132260 RepID=UPI0039A62447